VIRLDLNIRNYILVCVIGVTINFTSGLISPILPLYIRKFTTALPTVGIIMSSFFIVRLFLEFPFGVITDSIGPKKPLMLGGALMTVGSLLFWTAPNTLQLFLAYLIWGVGSGAFYCVSMVYITKIFGVRNRGKALGAFQFVEMVSIIFGSSLSGFAILFFRGYRNFFLLCTILVGMTLFPVALIKAQRYSIKHHPRGILDRLVNMRKFLSLRDLRITPTLALASLIYFSNGFLESGLIGTIIPIYAKFSLKIPVTEIGLLMAANSLGSALGTISGGTLSDRIRRRTVLAAGFVIAILSVYCLTFACSFFQLALPMLLNGVAFGFIYSVTPVFVSDAVPRANSGASIGALRVLFDVGGLTGPILMTNITEYGGFRVAAYVVSILLLLNLFSVIFSRS